ncbi:MAG TPA: hypothetical protein VEY93_01800 [Longimicrobium sp.]|nr:hypothetical protein [Longimicrobium sp.]
MSDERREFDDALEEVRAIRRQLWTEFDNDPVKLGAYLSGYEKQFADRLILTPEQQALAAQTPGEPGKSAA